MMSAMCHHSWHIHISPLCLLALAMRWRQPRAEGRPFAAAKQHNKKRPNMETLCLTASFGYPEAATNFFMAQDSVCENALMMHLKIFKHGWFQTPRDCHRLEEILHILDHKSKLFLSFLPQSCPSLTFTDRAGSSRFLFCVPTLEWFGLKLVQTCSVVTKFSSAICVLFMFGCWAYKDSSAWWCYDWLEPSIRESIVTARKWPLKASWNFKMKKVQQDKVKWTPHNQTKAKVMSWLMIKTSTAIFGSCSLHSLREVLWDVCSLVIFVTAQDSFR